MPPNPTGPRVSSGDSRREPATIDLKATEVRTDATGGESSSEATTNDASAEPAAEQMQARPTPDEVIPTDEPAASPEASAEASVPLGASAETPTRGPGFGGLLAAGVVGGVVGAGAMILAQSWLLPPTPANDSRPATVEQRAAPAPEAISALERRLAALEAESKSAAERLRTTQALAERGAQQAEAALNRPLPSPAPAPEPAPDNAAAAAAVTELTARVSGLETQARERADAASAVTELTARVSGLETQARERAEAASALQERVQAGAKAAEANAGAVQGLERRLGEQDQRLADFTRQLSERGPDAITASLRLVIAERVADALRDGAPLGQLLALLRRLEVKPDSLQPLAPYAENGAPKAAALLQEFRPLGRRMIDETRPAPSDWNDRLWSVLGKVVTVRSLAEPRGTDAASLVTRIETALGNDAVTDAAAAWDALPEAARRVAPAWGEKLKQRAAAEAAAQRISTEAVSALQALAR
jgi:hypothetical protein